MSLDKKFFIGGGGEITPTDYFAPVTYTGNGSTQSISSLSFAPDFIWFKDRSSSSENHWLFDVLRGTNIGLSSNLTGGNYTLTNTLNSFDTNGFTVGLDGKVNRSSDNYVAWAWKAGGTAAVSNTDGSITSSVSASPESGFSIVEYTAPSGSTTKFTAGHGLSASPQLVITRRTGGTSNWYTYTEATGAEKFLMLNQNNAQSSTITDFWGTDGMSSTTIGLTNNQACYPNEEHIAYCFHSVSGYQAVGSYNGASTTNPISIGFQPRFVLIKKYTGADDWIIYDSIRGEDLKLRANQSNAEDSTRDDLDFTSTGFTLKGSFGLTNAINQSYIYLAIA